MWRDWFLLGLVYNLMIAVAALTQGEFVFGLLYDPGYVGFLNLCYLAGPLLELFVWSTRPTRSDFYACRFLLFCGGSALACGLTLIMAVSIAF